MDLMSNQCKIKFKMCLSLIFSGCVVEFKVSMNGQKATDVKE